jgi:hypothetical protein
MRFARWTFIGAAIYGVIVLAPLLFLEGVLARTTGPLTYPEYYYGFLGSALVFQLVFVLIGRDPVRHRPLMLAAVAEKWVWGPTVWWLVLHGRTHGAVVVFATIDLALGVLFSLAYARTPKT